MSIPNQLIFALWAIVLLAATACQQNEGKPGVDTDNGGMSGRTVSGYPYQFHIKGDGAKAQVGDEIFYHQRVLKNDTLLQSTYYSGKPRQTVMPSRDSVATPPPPHYDALFLMAPGDSLTVYQLLDTFDVKSLPPGVTNQDTFVYVLKVYRIRPKAEVDAGIAALKAREQSVADSLRVKAKDYLAGKLNDQITTSASGLKYIIHEPGEGKQAASGKFVDVHYSGILRSGENFDNSFKNLRPYTFRVGRGLVIQGWDEAIPMLKVGGKATLFIPYQLAYGVAGRPPEIPERSELIFYVELVDVRF
ncbi:MAG: FKBP-type peptidyl-prolyl cis-trans isomerase [Bacteroidota bacterium]